MGTMWKSIAVAMSLLPTSLMANDGNLMSLDASFDCGSVDRQVRNFGMSSDGFHNESLQVYFQDFVLQNEGVGYQAKNCELNATIKVPAGMQFRAVSAEMAGVFQMAEDAKGSASLFYQLSPMQTEAFWSQNFNAGNSGDFKLVAQMDDWNFTACSAHDQYVKLNSEIDIDINQNRHGYSYVAMDEANNNYELSWSWQWKKCPEKTYFDQGFVSYYKAYNQRNYQAMLDFDGDRGSFQSDAGFTGQFSNVTYTLGGKVANGEWSAQNSEGWFRFEIVDERSGRFEGEWGDHSGAVGRWWGYYQ
ncbi:MAG: DUF4360 domain-containing protein [Oligoflexus sp.]